MSMQYQHEHGETHRDRGLRQSLKRQRNQILRVMRERIRGSSLIIQTGRGPLVYSGSAGSSSRSFSASASRWAS
jgi:hypothetical protein